MENWRKYGPCYKIVKNICSSVLLKVEIMNDDATYLTQKISSVEEAAIMVPSDSLQ